MMLVFESSKSMAFRVTTVVICGGQVLSYLLVGLSNPGVVM